MSDTISKEFVVYGMTCKGCVRGVTDAVGKVAGRACCRRLAGKSPRDGRVRPVGVAPPAQIVKAIEGAGFEAKPALNVGPRRIGRGSQRHNPGPAGCSAAR